MPAGGIPNRCNPEVIGRLGEFCRYAWEIFLKGTSVWRQDKRAQEFACKRNYCGDRNCQINKPVHYVIFMHALFWRNAAWQLGLSVPPCLIIEREMGHWLSLPFQALCCQSFTGKKKNNWYKWSVQTWTSTCTVNGCVFVLQPRHPCLLGASVAQD